MTMPLKRSFVWKDLYEVPQHAPGVRRGFVLGRRARGRDDASKGRFHSRPRARAGNADVDLIRTDRAKSYPHLTAS